MTRADIKRVVVNDLRADKQPIRCERCHGGPGDPGCGKIVHIIMDDYFNRAMRLAGIMEADTHGGEQ